MSKKDKILDVLTIAAIVVGIPLIAYLFIVYIMAVVNVSNITCPKGQTLVMNPWSAGTSGKCEP